VPGALQSFLPALLWRSESLRTGTPRACENTFNAAVMLADISGFTRLAERLARLGGAEGAEQLTRVLNEHFGAFIDVVARHGGDVVKFAGDALVVVWPEMDGAHNAALRAVSAGLEMQGWITRRAGGEDARLAVKVCISVGQMRLQQIGGVRNH
jgi:class 3 adenylate cyclase